MHVEQDLKLGFKDVLIRPKRSTLKSRSQVSLERTFVFRNCGQSWTGTPIISANMDTTGTFETATVLGSHGMLTALHKHYSLSDFELFLRATDKAIFDRFAISTGTSPEDFQMVSQLLKLYPAIRFVCVDVANGYSEHFIDFVKRVRTAFPDVILMAGNVVTGDITEELILAGADIVKVGIGPGSVCTTRIQTGVGYPQLSAVIECADAAHGLGGQIISDGGCTCPGDVAKAFGAGADFVMIGGLFAGHDESGGELVEEDGQKFKLFYGMSSETAMDKYHGGVADYRASEGKTVKVPYRGPIENTVQTILGGVRSTCTYVGASKLKELTKRTTFIRVQEQASTVFKD